MAAFFKAVGMLAAIFILAVIMIAVLGMNPWQPRSVVRQQPQPVTTATTQELAQPYQYRGTTSTNLSTTQKFPYHYQQVDPGVCQYSLAGYTDDGRKIITEECPS